jgi:hypothetical protein
MLIMGIYLKSIPSNIKIPTSLGHPWAFASLTDTQPQAEDIRT